MRAVADAVAVPKGAEAAGSRCVVTLCVVNGNETKMILRKFCIAIVLGLCATVAGGIAVVSAQDASPGKSSEAPTDPAKASAAAKPAAAADPASHADADLIERGKYLALAGDCMPCHTGAPKEEFAGGLPLNTPFGVIYSPNITPDKATGIGKWTFDDFKHAVHDGIRADGAYLYPAMPYTAFTNIEDNDLKAIWAFLRSLKPINKPQKANGLGFPFNIRDMMFFWRTLFFDEGYFKPDKSKSAEWNRGAYLVEALAHCNACHTPRNLMGATIPSERFHGAQIDNWFAPDITEKALKQVNKWDKAKMVAFLKQGKTANSTTLGPMHVVVHDSLSRLKDSDITAIATYMLNDDTGVGDTVEPQHVAEMTPESEAHAKQVYNSHCAMCHQKTGEGMPGKVPPLKGNPTVEAADPYNIFSVVLGGVPGRNGLLTMPSFASQLSNQDIADVANYVRITWGNKSQPDATPAMVASWRSQVEPPTPAKTAAKPAKDDNKADAKAAAKSTGKPDAKPDAKTADAGSAKPAAAKSSKGAAPAPAPAAAAAAAPATNPLPPPKPYYIVTSDMIGLDVHSQDDYAQTLGTLSSFIIDSTTGDTLYAIIDRGGFLGMGEYKIVVPFELVKFTGQWDNPMLAMSAFKVENAPRIDDNAIEDLLQSKDWRKSVADYFGVALQEPNANKTGKSGRDSMTKTAEIAKTDHTGKAAAPKETAAQMAIAKGKQIADAQCTACHHFSKGGGTLVGPDLYGVFGTKIASVPGYSFSSALKKHTGDWTAAKLEDWLKSPSTFAPGTYMTFPGLPNAKDREDVIAYLESLK
jgi:cytochrome c2